MGCLDAVIRRRIRLGLPKYASSLPGHTGHGRAWQLAIDALVDSGDVRLVKTGGWRRPPDVWLADGHQRVRPVSEPVVAVVYDAGWGTPELDATFDPEFLEAIIDNTHAAVDAASVVVVPSESTKQQMHDQFGKPADRIVLAPLGVDLEIFRPFTPGGPEIVGQAGGDPASPYVLFIGAAHPRENIGVLRDAMTALAAEGLPHQLVLGVRPAGDRRDSARLMVEATADLPDTKGRVVSLPLLEDEELAAVMAGATALCLPSLMEGFGLPVLEAMACGTAAVTSDRGSLPELVGDAGLVVPPTVEAITAALGSVLTDPALGIELRQRARARAETFTWKRTAGRWLEALQLARKVG